jgi:galactose mutarotase-like enzyme
MDFAELTIEHTGVAATVAPARGAIVTSLQVAGRDRLFMVRATLLDPDKSVRGGIPLLFPFAGRLDGDRLLHAGSTMKQHGFARNKAWRVGEQRPGRLSLTLEDDAQAREVYPHRFRLEQTMTLLPRGLQLDLAMHNLGEVPMPVAPGWHPYFSCPSPDKPRVQPLGVPGLDPARFTPDAEFDFGVSAPAGGRADFEIPGLGQLRLGYSPEMRFLQCWGLPGRDFICLEPFVGPNNTINMPQRLDVAPGDALTVWMRIEVTSPAPR